MVMLGSNTSAAVRRSVIPLRRVFTVWPMAYRASRAFTILLVASTLLTGAVPPLYAWTAKRLIDCVVAAPIGVLGSKSALFFVFLEFVILSSDFVLARLRDLAKTALSDRFGSQLTLRILGHASEISLASFSDPRVHDKIRRALDSKWRAVQMLSESLQLLRAILILSAFSAMLTHVSAWLVAMITLASMPNFVGGTTLSRATFQLSKKQTPAARELSYIEELLIRSMSVKEIKGYALAPRLFERYTTIGDRRFGETIGLMKRGAAIGSALHTISTLMLYGCYGAIVWRAIHGELSVGQLTLYAFVLRDWESSFGAMLGAARDLREHTLFTDETFSFLEDRAILEGAVAVAAGAKVERSEAGHTASHATRPGAGLIEFEDVWFAYANPEHVDGSSARDWVLRGITLRIEPGECIALVGSNGAGKSTLISLLLGFYRPTRGIIRIDGVDICDIDRKTLRRQFAVFFQDFTHFQDTVRENIRYGDTVSAQADERVPIAAGISGASEMIDALPRGYDTRLGSWFDDSVELSGGQWQMVSLARAFMREAGFLILDEPTAALDPENEHEMFQRLQQLMRGRTTLFVSHRMKTVRMANRIVVLQAGRVVEMGSHGELVAVGGRYAHLCKLQEAPVAPEETKPFVPGQRQRMN
jgi:ATP-binding cassette subfamily B protein